MNDAHNHRDPPFDAIAAECARIGFPLRELGGLAFTGEDALAAFHTLLQEIPTGAGIAGLRKRMPNVVTAEEELGQLTRDEPTICSFCGQRRTEGRRLVSGPNHVAICSECVRRAAEWIE